jgi:hypothetical protein
MEVAIFRHCGGFSFYKVLPKHYRILRKIVYFPLWRAAEAEFKFGSFLLWIATRFRRWHGNRSRWWMVRPSVRFSVTLACRWVCCAHWFLSQLCRKQTLQWWQAADICMGEGWAGPGQGKTNNNGFRRISVLFFSPSFLISKFWRNLNQKRESKISRIYTRKKKIENVPNFFVEK